MPLSKPMGSILLVLPLFAHRSGSCIMIEGQAGNGLQQWLRHFESLTLVVRLLPGDAPKGSVSIANLGLGNRLTVVTAPIAWNPIAHLRAYPSIKRLLTALIDGHDYLQFAIGGLWGDWAAVGALIAASKARKASVWTDRVESEVMRLNALRAKGIRRLYRLTNAWLAKILERWVISRCTIGLFHGADTFQAYHKYNSRPLSVHNIHLKKEDRISSTELADKVRNTEFGPLKIIYAGRVHPDKGVMDWINTISRALADGLECHAEWLGDGPQLDEARNLVRSLGIAEHVSFPGAVLDRAKVIEALRTSHVMMFCHLTPESPRCLVEALACGTPIIGYQSAYAEDLIAANKGGRLTPASPSNLARILKTIGNDRTLLSELIANAARDGHDMNDEAVFLHRSELIKEFT